MSQIIFERLKVKEEERVTAGNTSSNNNTPSGNIIDIDITYTTAGAGCIRDYVLTNAGDSACTLWISVKG